MRNDKTMMTKPRPALNAPSRAKGGKPPRFAAERRYTTPARPVLMLLFSYHSACASWEKRAPAIPVAVAADIAGGPRAFQTAGTLRVP